MSEVNPNNPTDVAEVAHCLGDIGTEFDHLMRVQPEPKRRRKIAV